MYLIGSLPSENVDNLFLNVSKTPRGSLYFLCLLIVCISLWSRKPSDPDFGQNWKPGTGEIHLLSLNDPKGLRCMNRRHITWRDLINRATLVKHMRR
jgi:hypothetical protein